ncbi:hypothetical protein TNIN_211771 [Trichonephila inaurata madagascariensis]|uniref:Uncharacterized protein n=1 Tax=Trichonephila inaurata madagascariensis TaxID=2747483 RepID=A0A8X6KJE2_9ARAC|nr:hypothetical protein TNIN_211771 [Trichonephila inaurata madagascariensis]
MSENRINRIKSRSSSSTRCGTSKPALEPTTDCERQAKTLGCCNDKIFSLLDTKEERTNNRGKHQLTTVLKVPSERHLKPRTNW